MAELVHVVYDAIQQQDTETLGQFLKTQSVEGVLQALAESNNGQPLLHDAAVCIDGGCLLLLIKYLKENYTDHSQGEVNL